LREGEEREKEEKKDTPLLIPLSAKERQRLPTADLKAREKNEEGEGEGKVASLFFF